MHKSYNITFAASFIGLVTQGIVINFLPLMFVFIQNHYEIPLEKITLLITLNFTMQITLDFSSAYFIDKIGYRTTAILSQIFTIIGFGSLLFLPDLIPNHFIGFLISDILYAIGGGLIEVTASPIVEACPSDNKEKAMSLLHSFYCWGVVFTILITTLFFKFFGIENWKIMVVIWLIVPIIDLVLFIFAPINNLLEKGEISSSIKDLFTSKIFIIMFILMICSGAAEIAVAQWASMFTEDALHVDKTLGDLLGAMLFAFMAGIARSIYGKFGEKLKLERFMFFSGVLCVISYIMISLIPNAIVSLIGCMLCGFSIGIMWPGSLSISAKTLPKGGTKMFSMLSLAGDLGCTIGPTIVGFISAALNNNLKLGILSGITFPIILLICLFYLQHISNKKKL